MYCKAHPVGKYYTLFFIALLIGVVSSNVSFAQTPWFGIPTKSTQYLYCIDVVGTNVMYTGGTAGVLYKSTDKGLNWNAINTGTHHWIMGLDFINEQEGWVAYINSMVGSSEIRHTTDGGKTWTPMLNDEGVEFNDIVFLNEHLGWACVRKPLYYATDDGGKNWHKHTLEMLDTADWSMKIQFVTPERGWLSTFHGKLLSTVDGGKTWNVSSAIIGIEDFDFIDTQTGWVLYNGQVRKTTDGGKNWSSVPIPYTFKLNRIQFKNNKEGWILGGVDCSKGTCTSTPVLMHSTDGGATWVDDIHPFTDIPMAYYDLALSNDGTLYVSGYGGRVAAFEPNAVSVQESPLPPNLFTPNPCAVGHPIAVHEKANIYGYALYDMLGKRVQMETANGAPIQSINTHSLRKGMYSVQLYNYAQQVQRTSLLFLY